MSYFSKVVQQAATQTGLLGDETNGILTGSYAGYTVVVCPMGNFYTIKAATRGTNGMAMSPDFAKQIAKGSKAIAGVRLQGYQWTVNVKRKSNAAKTAANITDALNYITEVMRSNNQINVCAKCGQQKPTEGIIVGNAAAVLCEDCYHSEQQAGLQRQMALESKSENVVGGVVGALLGSVLGVIVKVILGQIGFVSAISGVVMGVCALKGYELLGGKLTKKGIVVSVIIMILMVWVGNRLDWAITLRKEVYTEDSLFTVFRYLGEGLRQLKDAGADVSGYYTNLAMQYGFSALGAVSTILSTVRNARNANTTTRLR